MRVIGFESSLAEFNCCQLHQLAYSRDLLCLLLACTGGALMVVDGLLVIECYVCLSVGIRQVPL